MGDNLVFWISGIVVPIILGGIGLFIQHQRHDSRVELEVKTKQAYIDGMTHGLQRRVDQLEDFRDSFINPKGD